jgi:2-polyprenyl-3-methyl-5-hydroxy-6-metoxy-1,4-benzoquinol methylase
MSKNQWDRLATCFEDEVCDITAVSGDLLSELVHRVRPGDDRVLVDAGCGIGSFIDRFGSRYGEIVAFDFAPRMVGRAKQRCKHMPHVTWRTMGLEDAASKIGPVGDLTVCLNVITSTNVDLRERQWTSLAGLSKPGGQVLVVVPSIESARHVIKHIDASNEIHGSKVDDGLIFRGDEHQKHYGREELRQTVWCHGLRVQSLRRIFYPWTDEGLSEELSVRRPWDWVCLARKPSRRRRTSGESPSNN